MVKGKLIGFVATKQAEKAREFYGKTLGLKFVSEDPFAIVFEAERTEFRSQESESRTKGDRNDGGRMLRVQKVQDFQPAGYTVLGWEVADIVAEVKALTAKGVKFERYGFLEQDELGVWSAPGGAKVAWFRDPDGNVLSLTEFK